MFDFFQPAKQVGRLELAFNYGDGIGEVSPGSSVSRIEHDRRGVEQAEVLIEPGDRRLDYAGRAAEAAVRAIGSDRDRVEVGHS